MIQQEDLEVNRNYPPNREQEPLRQIHSKKEIWAQKQGPRISIPSIHLHTHLLTQSSRNLSI